MMTQLSVFKMRIKKMTQVITIQGRLLPQAQGSTLGKVVNPHLFNNKEENVLPKLYIKSIRYHFPDLRSQGVWKEKTWER